MGLLFKGVFALIPSLLIMRLVVTFMEHLART
jgi:hypothetical protein